MNVIEEKIISLIEEKINSLILNDIFFCIVATIDVRLKILEKILTP
jgi:hypothetical protein